MILRIKMQWMFCEFDSITSQTLTKVTTVDYCGDFIYVNGVLKRMLIPGGYVTFTNDDINQPGVKLTDSGISAKALSKIFTHIVGRMPEVDLNELDGKQINVVKWSRDIYSNCINVDDQYGNCNDGDDETNANTAGNNITVFFGGNEKKMFETQSNIQNMLGVEEYTCHFKNQWHHYQKGSGKSNKTDNIKIFNQIMSHPTWNKTTDTYKKLMLEYKNKLLRE